MTERNTLEENNEVLEEKLRLMEMKFSRKKGRARALKEESKNKEKI